MIGVAADVGMYDTVLRQQQQQLQQAAGSWVVGAIDLSSSNVVVFVLLLLLLQVAKLLVIPFVCCVEAVSYGRRFNNATVMSIATVVLGVAVV